MEDLGNSLSKNTYKGRSYQNHGISNIFHNFEIDVKFLLDLLPLEMKETVCKMLNDEQQDESSDLVRNILKKEISNIKTDISCNIAEQYKVINDLNPETWFAQRNGVLKAVVEGLAPQGEGRLSWFQKCVALSEHLYSLTSPPLVAPFSFTTKIVVLANTNSKIAVNLFAKSLPPGGTYCTLKSWMKNLTDTPLTFPSGSCAVAIDNQIVSKKYKVRVGQKSRVSVVTSMCQAEIDDNDDLQRQEDLAPRYDIALIIINTFNITVLV